MGEFVYLSVGELFVFFEALGHGRRVVADITIGGGPLVRPIVIAVPVGLGEVEARPEAFFTEGFHHLASDVGFGIFRERAAWVDGGVGGLLSVEQAETVVVLCGEDDVLHACVFGGLGPFRWVEVLWIKGFVKIMVISLVFIIVGTITVDPRLVADGPRLHHFPLGVDAPVHHEAEFQILPLADAVGDDGVGFGELFIGLGESHHANKA